MALLAKQGSFNITTAAVTTTQSITGVGFQPKALIFWWSGNQSSTDAVTAENGGPGIGFAASSTSRRTSCTIQGNGYATTEENIQINDAACINNIGINGADQGAADFVSFDADGFTVVIDVQFTNANRIHYLALGGDSLTGAECFTFQVGSTGNQSISSLSGQPDCVLFISTADATAPPTQDNGSSFGFGAAVSSSQRAFLGGHAQNNTGTTSTVAYCLDIECAAGWTRNTGITTTSRLDFVSMDANGFTVNVLETASLYMMGMALYGGEYAIVSGATRTDGNDIALTGAGFAPAAGMVASHNNTESAQDTVAAHYVLTLGGFSSATDRGVQACRNENGVGTSNVATAVEHDEVYCGINPTTTTIDALMDIKSMDSDGVTFVMDDPSASAKFFWTLLMGPAAAEGRRVFITHT